MRRLAAACGLAVVLTGVLPAAAWAEWARPLPDPERPGVAVGVPAGQGRGGDGEGGEPCSWLRFDEEEDAKYYQQLQPPGQTGGVYLYNCGTPDNPSPGQLGWFPEPPPAPETLAQEAARRLSLPVPRLGINPPPDAQQPPLVNLPVWLWVERSSWRPVEETAWVPGVWATVRATPVQVTWSTGDGDHVVCAGPGQPYTTQAAGQRPSCGHTYTQPGRYELTATVTYQVRWSSPAGGGELPAVVSSSSLSVPVGELPALN